MRRLLPTAGHTLTRGWTNCTKTFRGSWNKTLSRVKIPPERFPGSGSWPTAARPLVPFVRCRPTERERRD